MIEMITYYLAHDVLFFLISSLSIGILVSLIIEKITERICSTRRPGLYDSTNTISEGYIQNCICFNSDKGRSIDDVVKNLKDTKIDFQFSMEF